MANHNGYQHNGARVSPFANTLLDDADAATMQATLALFSSGTADTPTVTSTSGTITTVTGAAARYFRLGKLVFWQAQATITDNGTGSGKLRFTLPSALGNVTNKSYYGTGRASGVSGQQLLAHFTLNQQYAELQTDDDTYPASTGEVILVSGWYEVA